MSGTGGVIIRPARPGDENGIARVHVESWRSTYRGIMPDAVLDGLSQERRARHWKTVLESQDVREFVFVAETEPGVCRESRQCGQPGELAKCEEFGQIAKPGESGASGEIVGFAVGGPERDGDPVYKGALYAIYLLEKYQRQGLGRRLVAAVAQELIRRDLCSMLVWVLVDNPACGFYEALGGRRMHSRPITIGPATLEEVAYGWPDLRAVRFADWP